MTGVRVNATLISSVPRTMTVSKLLFELSGSTMFGILQALASAPMTFTKMRKQVDMTSPEASRQIARLAGADLIEKHVDGMYHITPFGRLVLSFLPSIDFVYENRDYFRTHDTAQIPHELVMRLGDLTDATFLSGAIDAMNHVQGQIRNVKEYHCAMVDAVMRPLVLPVTKNIRSGATFRLIFPDAYKEEFFQVMDEYAVADECLRAMSIRTLPTVSIYTGVTDAGCWFKLPGFDGRIDHSVMVAGSSPSFSEWCRDLYAYLLGAGKPGEGLYGAVVRRASDCTPLRCSISK